MTTRGHFQIATSAEWEAVASPAWIETVEFLIARHEATAADLAAFSGRPRTSVYHHLRKLESLGLVHAVGSRPGPRRPEAVFALRTRDIRLGPVSPDDRESMQGFKKAYEAVLRYGSRAFTAAADAGALHTAPGSRQWVTFVDLGRLSPAEHREVMDHAMAIDKIIADSRQRDDGELMCVTVSVVPVVR